MRYKDVEQARMNGTPAFNEEYKDAMRGCLNVYGYEQNARVEAPPILPNIQNFNDMALRE